MIKRLVLCLGMILMLYITDVPAQKINPVGTTWVLKYTTGKANSNDYQEYAKITFKKGGKAIFDNGETARWTLAGNKLTVQNDNNDTVLVHYVEVKIKGTSGTGTGGIGMTTTVPYWVRLVKQK